MWTTPRKVAVLGLAAVLLVALSFLAFQAYRPADSDPTIHSLAVLPFANNNPGNEYLSDGITESLIENLSRVPNLKVKSRSTVFHYKGRETDPKKIGRDLGVHALLSGSVNQVGDDLSVNVELIDVRDDSHIWGETYGRKISEIVALPQQISRDVSSTFRLIRLQWSMPGSTSGSVRLTGSRSLTPNGSTGCRSYKSIPYSRIFDRKRGLWSWQRSWDWSRSFSLIEQVRKGGLPPLFKQRGQAPLPDLFIT